MNRFPLFALLLIILLSSCASPRYVHNPVAVNNPFFTGQQDSKLGAYVSGGFTNTNGNYNKGFDLLSAYAISNHVAVTASFSNRRERNYYNSSYISPFDTSLVRYRRSGWEAGAGFFAPLDRGKHISVNVYGGIGNGSLRINETGLANGVAYARFHQSSPFKIYIQPGINFLSSFTRFGFAYRLNYLRFKNLRTDYSISEQEGLKLNGLANKSLLFRELAFELHFLVPGTEWLALESQLSLCSDEGYYRSRAANGSAGLSVDLYKLLKHR
jgi:hypothetical protein